MKAYGNNLCSLSFADIYRMKGIQTADIIKTAAPHLEPPELS